MESEAYKKLEESLSKNELTLFLLGCYGYRLNCDDRNFPIMNDYVSLVKTLNNYGEIHPSFAEILSSALLDCLDLKSSGAIYSVMQIILCQLSLEKHSANSISFINNELLEKLKIGIINNKEYFENWYEFEGIMYKNGMYGAFVDWNEEIYKSTGHKIL